jgi:hypothetical protein
MYDANRSTEWPPARVVSTDGLLCEICDSNALPLISRNTVLWTQQKRFPFYTCCFTVRIVSFHWSCYSQFLFHFPVPLYFVFRFRQVVLYDLRCSVTNGNILRKWEVDCPAFEYSLLVRLVFIEIFGHILSAHLSVIEVFGYILSSHKL